MSNYRKALIDRMIHLYGFEDEKVVNFSNQCEKYADSYEWDNILWMIVRLHEDYPMTDEE